MPRLDFYANFKFFIQLSLQETDVILGRGPTATVVLPKKSVSREHAIIRKRDDGYWIEDTSRFGTRVNAAMIEAPTRLQEGDRIYISDFAIIFQPDDAPTQEWGAATTKRP